MKEKEVVEENEEEEEGISKNPDITYIHTDTQIQYNLKTENTLPAAPWPAAPFGGGGLGSIILMLECILKIIYSNLFILEIIHMLQ